MITADGFNEAIIGIDTKDERVIYSKEIMTDILIKQGMNYEESIEYLEFNVWCAYVGKHTPIYMDKITFEQLKDL